MAEAGTVETLGAHTHGAHHEQSFWSKYVFPTDHKMIAMQYMFTGIVMALIGGYMSYAFRMQLAFPGESVPSYGLVSHGEYNALVTNHGTIMIFWVAMPLLIAAFGNFLIPLMIGADDMAFPLLNALSYWFMLPAIGCFGASFFFGGGPAAGWTSYPVLSALQQAAPGSGPAQTLWLFGVTFIGVSSMMGSINYLTTIINMRAPGMTLFRMPLTIWAMFITAILQAFALPVLTAAGFMLVFERVLGFTFFIPGGLVVNNADPTVGGGQPLQCSGCGASWRKCSGG